MTSAHDLTRRTWLGALGGALAMPNLLSAGYNDTNNPRYAWYREAKFGMFIHWGPYSQASVEASWPIMRPESAKAHPISEADYVALAKTFNPVNYDPVKWVRLAKSAGQRYMVFTTKHHDGFCMFDSSFTSYKITNTPYGKDAVAMLANAAREENMRLGFYYSPPDMHHPAFRDTSKPVSENWQGQPERAEWPLYLDYMGLQLTELLTRYGDVCIIWFDGLSNQQKYDGERFLRLIHNYQAETLVNNRIGLPADYETPEQFIPKAIPTKGVRILGIDPKVADVLPGGVPQPDEFRLWETCMTINNTWAYNKWDRDFKSSRHLIRSLVEVASRGGNFLLNVGPEPDGTIQPEFQERLHAIGKWLDVNGEAIYGTLYGPLQGLENVRLTAKNSEVFVHVFDWPSGELSLNGLKPRVYAAELLATHAPLEFKQDEKSLTISLPAVAPDPDVSVIRLRTS
jgi:alpha-L-fucosidase